MKIIIEGAGEVGSHLAKMLRAEDNDVAIIDTDAERLRKITAQVDVLTFAGDPTSISLLKDAGAADADLLVAVTPFVPQEVNIAGALMAKQLGTRKVVARVKSEEYLTEEGRRYLGNCGIDYAFYPEKIAADEVVTALRSTSSAEVLDLANGKLQLVTFRLNDESSVLDLKLSEVVNSISEEARKMFRIISIQRKGKSIIPTLDTKFYYGDVVFVVTKHEVLDTVSQIFGKETVQAAKIIIVGGGETGEMVARELTKLGLTVKIIENDHERCLELTENLPDTVEITKGDGRNSDLLFDEGIRECDVFLSLTNQDESNILACLTAKRFGIKRTMAKVENLEYIRMAEELGVDNIINKKLMAAGHVFRLTLNDKARYVRCLTGTDAEVLEYTASQGSEITGKQLKNIDFPENSIVVGVTRGEDAFIAVGETTIMPGDRVTIFVMPKSIRKIEKLFR